MTGITGLNRCAFRLALIFIATLCCSVGWNQAASAGSPGKVDLQLQGVWGGAVKAIFPDPDSDKVYVGSGRRLVILNITDNPKGGVDITELGSIDLESTVNDIK